MKKVALILYKSKLKYLLTSSLICIWAYARGQDAQWDAFNYHYFNGWALLHDNFLNNLNPVCCKVSYLNPIPDLINYFALSLPITQGTSLLILMNVPMFYITYLLTKELLPATKNNENYLFLAWTLSILTPIWLSEIGTSFVESWLSVLVLFSLKILLSNLQKTIRKQLVIAGVMFGLATGLKLTFAIYAMPLIAVIIIFKKTKKIYSTFLFLIGVLVGIIPSIWWYWKLYSRFNNPVFPFYNAFFKSTFFESRNFRDERWQIDNAHSFVRYIRENSIPTGFNRLTSELPILDLRILLALVGICLLLFFRKSNLPFSKELQINLVFILTSYIIWIKTFAYDRYQVPTAILLGILISQILATFKKYSVNTEIVLVLILVIHLFSMQVPDWGHVKPKDGKSIYKNVTIPQELRTKESLIIAVAPAVSWIFTSMNQNSHFYSLSDSNILNDKIIAEIKKKIRSGTMHVWLIYEEERDLESITDQLGELKSKIKFSEYNCRVIVAKLGGIKLCKGL